MCEKGTEFKFGQTDQSMKVGGETIQQMEEEDSFMLTETCLRETGKMTRLTGWEFTLIWMELGMKDSGRKIVKMEMESRHGQTGLDTKVSTDKERNMVKVTLCGLTGHDTKGNS